MLGRAHIEPGWFVASIGPADDPGGAMTFEEFRCSLAHTQSPGMGQPLEALWHDARGHWDEAHRVVQDLQDASSAWVHAYLHRKEGNLENARYWYGVAGQSEPTDSVDAEWSRMVRFLLLHNSLNSSAFGSG